MLLQDAPEDLFATMRDGLTNAQGARRPEVSRRLRETPPPAP